MIIIANTGRRVMCRCIDAMEIVVGKEHRELFSKGQVYHCTIRDNDRQQINYKIYGGEFDLSCTEVEFDEHFVLIKNKKTGIKKDEI